MTRFLSPFAVALACALLVGTSAPASSTTVRDIRSLPRAQAEQGQPVTVEATVTFFRPEAHDLFVQDGNEGIYVETDTTQALTPGDRVLIKGTTRWGYVANISSNDIKVIGHNQLPAPVAARFDQLMQGKVDSTLVTVHGIVHAADINLPSGTDRPIGWIKVLTDGGYIDAEVMTSDTQTLNQMLDAEVQITGIAGGKFDGKMQLIGAVLRVGKLDDIKVIKFAAVNPWQLPVTPMDQILRASKTRFDTPRVRVEGTVTYFEPGAAAVLQSGGKSLWVKTASFGPVRVGDRAEAIGFPDVVNESLVLTGGEIRDTGVPSLVSAAKVTSSDLRNRKREADLVSIEGAVMMEVRESFQDEYVLLADGQLFSAIYPHKLEPNALPAMKEIANGSLVRVTGICVKSDENPFSHDTPFNILIRSTDDLAVVAPPSIWTVRNLTRMILGLLLAMLLVGARALWAGRRMRSQVAELGYLSQRRGEILEDINRSRPLTETLERITELASMTLKGSPCWCRISEGPIIGNRPTDLTSSGLRTITVPVAAHAGHDLGVIHAAFDARTEPKSDEMKALDAAAALATLAVETSRLHSDLIHRSEFDMLTEIQNRFAFEKRLEELIAEARRTAGMFALIYIDLNDFKQVNDRYGHQSGDIYLQKVAERMKHQLRARDMLARLGGDEFGVLVSIIHNRNEAEDILKRLECCFDEPFAIKSHVLHGSASIGLAVYPVDGVTDDGLMSIADAAMYVKKRLKNNRANRLSGEPVRKFIAS
jgi:diguanylate cyclase (GGDEF) domain